MPPLGIIIVFGWVILTALAFIISTFFIHFYSIRLTRYIKRNEPSIWADAFNKADWIGMRTPAFIFQISTSSVPEPFDEKYSGDITYINLKNKAQISRKIYFMLFALCVVSITVGLIFLLIMY